MLFTQKGGSETFNLVVAFYFLVINTNVSMTLRYADTLPERNNELVTYSSSNDSISAESTSSRKLLMMKP